MREDGITLQDVFEAVESGSVTADEAYTYLESVADEDNGEEITIQDVFEAVESGAITAEDAYNYLTESEENEDDEITLRDVFEAVENGEVTADEAKAYIESVIGESEEHNPIYDLEVNEGYYDVLEELCNDLINGDITLEKAYELEGDAYEMYAEKCCKCGKCDSCKTRKKTLKKAAIVGEANKGKEVCDGNVEKLNMVTSDIGGKKKKGKK